MSGSRERRVEASKASSLAGNRLDYAAENEKRLIAAGLSKKEAKKQIAEWDREAAHAAEERAAVQADADERKHRAERASKRNALVLGLVALCALGWWLYTSRPEPSEPIGPPIHCELTRAHVDRLFSEFVSSGPGTGPDITDAQFACYQRQEARQRRILERDKREFESDAQDREYDFCKDQGRC